MVLFIYNYTRDSFGAGRNEGCTESSRLGKLSTITENVEIRSLHR